MRTRLALLWFAIAASAAVVLLPSCSDNSAGPDGGPSGPSWVAWRNPNVFSYSYYLNALWGSSSRDLYAVGSQMIIHYDGRKWSLVRYEETLQLNDVWGSSPEDVFAVGGEGAILHYDGVRWARMSSGTNAGLNAVWGRRSYDVYAVGETGTVLHYDGREWQSIESGTDRVLHSVWGGNDGAFAVGDGGTILRLTPGEVRPVEVLTRNNLYGIGGSSATGMYAVGAAGTNLRYDGSSWRPVRSGTLAGLTAVCGTEDGYVIVTAGSRILDFDGGEWGFMDVEPEGHDGFVDVWGLSIRSLFLLQTQEVLHYDGSKFSPMELPELPSGDEPGETLVDMWGASVNDIYAVGRAVQVGPGLPVPGAVLHYDGTDWTSTTTGGSDLEAVWGISESEIYAVSFTFDDPPPCFDPPCPGRQVFSSIFSSDGATWSEKYVIANKWIKSIWGVSGDALFAVGSFTEFWEEGNVGGLRYYRTILRYDGTAWSAMIEETTPGVLNDVWGDSENDVFAVGSGGAILHYDGSLWSEMTSGTSEDLNAVSGCSANDVFAVGANGTVLRFDGQAWLPMTSVTTKTINDVWGSSMNNVFAVGENGTILHFDGSEWGGMPSPTANSLYAVWGSAPNDVFAVGVYGTICHYGSH